MTNTQFKVASTREVGPGTFVLRFSRNGVRFLPGQYLSVGPRDGIHMREYSVYSGVEDDHLEILVKRVEDGFVSTRLGAMAEGDPLRVDGPFGFFTIDEENLGGKLVFVATGTGLSPFHCFVNSYPDLDYTCLHGIRSVEERYESDAFDSDRYIACISRNGDGDFEGRVTDYLRRASLDLSALYYMCGNCDMIYEVFDILQERGVPHTNLFAEVYF